MKLSRTVTGLLAVALLSFLVSDSFAQGRGRPGQGGPGGGGPGGGGFGQRGGGGGDPIFGLLRVDEVKAEIELMPDQEEAVGKLMEQGRGERPDFDFRNATEEERTEFFAKSQKEREEREKKMREQLEEVLLPGQIERLDQIALQIRGVRALGDEKVVKALKINDAQQKELDDVQSTIQEEMRSKMRELFSGGDRDAMREAFTKMREDSEKQILGVLTSAQREEFEKMKGEKFEMPEGAQRGGFGGPGGGGGRGGRGGGPGGAGGGGQDGGQGGRRARPALEE